MQKKFVFREETVNIGPGHGHHGDSGLIPSFVKYGKPLEEYYSYLSGTDKKVANLVFGAEHHGLFDAMGYKQFHD